MEIDTEKIQKEKSIEELIKFSIVNIDKPSGPTSFDVDLKIKKALEINKTSHFGTLDPMVTGVLPVALSRACRLMPYFIGKKKTYVGIMHIHEEIDEKKLKEEIKNFVGKIKQKPPVKSRVKREEREREIYSFDIIEIDGKNVLFKAEVEAGTYIRKLVSDLGDKIGGAHMTELRRVQASIFNENESVNVFDFLEAVEEWKKGSDKKLRKMLIPGEIISKVLPVVQVNKKYIERLYHGSPLFKDSIVGNVDFFPTHQPPASSQNNKIALFCGQNFIGVFRIINSKTVVAEPEFVLQPISSH